MPDLHDSFDELRRDLDATQAPDMLADAFHRAPSMGGPDGPSPWRRAGIIALALVIAIASTVFVVRAFDHDQTGPAAKTGVLPYPLAYAGADVPDPDWSHGHLWLMDEAGQRTTLASITDQTAVPAWSPDGSQIAFAAELDDLGTQIWLVNADGSDLHELTRAVPMEGSAINDAPAWSPDGTKIAFNCYDSQGHQVCVVNADGSGSPRKLTDNINVAHDTPPVWLGPNELMFSTSGPPAEGTYTLSLGGGEPTRIGSARPQMTLSPSGDRIAFLCRPTEHGYAICTEGTDLTGREQVTSPPTDLTAAITDSDSFPAWLPDGRLSFVRESRVFDGFHLYVVDAHGGAPTELANLGNDVRGLGWGSSADKNQSPSPAPQPTDSSPPAQPSPEGELSAAGLTASCGGSAFDQLPPDTSALSPFTSFDELDLSKVGGEAPFFKEFVSNYDWFVTQEGDGWRQLFGQPVGHRSDPPYASMRIEKGDGGWAPVGWGQCRVEVAAEGWGNARFVIDPKTRPDPEADQISVLATENACAGGQTPEGRQVKPVILSEDAHTISIVILVEPTQGATDCPGNPAFPVEVQLGSAIGDRVILDASVYPPERQWP